VPISVQIQGEHQELIGEAWWHPRSTVLLVDDHPGTCCLRFIDPYGDATFNQVQIPVLIAEIEALADRSVDTEGRATLRDLLAYLRTARDRPHVYVRFMGD
jgi:hypothetical protein